MKCNGKTRWYVPLFPAVAAAAWLAPCVADAELIAHDPFDYAPKATNDTEPSGTGITGLNGGTGFDGAWNDFATATAVNRTGDRGTGIISSDPSTFVTVGNMTSPLSYTDTNGNELVTSGNQLRTSFGDGSVAERALPQTYGNDGETIWLSFLGQRFDNTPNRRWSGISLGGDLGYFGVAANNEDGSATNFNWSFVNFGATAGEEEFIDTGVAAGSGEPSFVLVRIDYKAGAEDIYMWVNPDLTTEPAVATANDSGSAPLPTFDRIVVAGNWQSDFDEIRLGTTFDSVTPIVPEPATAALLGLGGALLMGRANRN